MSATNQRTLDLRGLDPPEPMVRILEALVASLPGTTLHARLDRKPLFLLEELQRRSQPSVCSQHADGGWQLILTVAAKPAHP
jgi:hypothetical protein